MPILSAIALEDLRDVLVNVGILIGLLLALAAALVLMKRWYGRTKEGVDSDELLTDFRNMVDVGELSPEEFKKIRASLGKNPVAAAKPKPPTKPSASKPTVSDEPL